MTSTERTFDPMRTYYLGADRRKGVNSCSDGAIDSRLAALPANAPITVGQSFADADGDVWVSSVFGARESGYALSECVLDDIPGAAEVREVRQGDRVMILEAFAIEDYVEQNPFGIVTRLSVNHNGDQVVWFKFDTDHGPDPAFFQGYQWCADEWALDVGVTAVTVASRDDAGSPAEKRASEEAERAIRAEEALAAFGTEVRDALLEYARRESVVSDSVWGDMDSILDSLGLEVSDTKEAYGLPTTRHSVVSLADGNLAILVDTDSEPWSVRDRDGNLICWSSFRDVGKGGDFTVIFRSCDQEVEVNND